MPHWPQNLAPDWFSAPQAAQVGASGAPHLMQNLFSALASAPQLGQLMGFPSRWLSLVILARARPPSTQFELVINLKNPSRRSDPTGRRWCPSAPTWSSNFRRES